MKTKVNILSSLVAVALMATATSCDGSTSAVGEPDNPVDLSRSYLLFGAPSGQLDWQPVTVSRAGEPPLMTDMPKTIGVWCYNDSTQLSNTGAGEVFRNTPLYNFNNNYDEAVAANVSPTWQDDWTNDWGYYNAPINSQMPIPWLVSRPRRPVKYKFFGYAPYVAEAAAYAESFVGFKDVVIPYLKCVSETDYMVGNTILQYTAAENPANNPVQVIEMVHVFSRLQFRFKMAERYDSLRTLIVKRLELINLNGMETEITISFNRVGDEYVASYGWDLTPQYGRYSTTELEVKEPATLDRTQFTPVASVYLYPYADMPTLTMRVTYDVRDKYGQLLRSDDQAVSTVELNMHSYTPGVTPTSTTLVPGHYRNVNILVKPTFLYVLSDNDMGHDGDIVLKP